jgi:hypothetical protein
MKLRTRLLAASIGVLIPCAASPPRVRPGPAR